MRKSVLCVGDVECMDLRELTPDEDVEHEHDEADDSAAGAVLCRGVLGGDGRGGAEGC